MPVLVLCRFRLSGHCSCLANALKHRAWFANRLHPILPTLLKFAVKTLFALSETHKKLSLLHQPHSTKFKISPPKNSLEFRSSRSINRIQHGRLSFPPNLTSILSKYTRKPQKQTHLSTPITPKWSTTTQAHFDPNLSQKFTERSVD